MRMVTACLFGLAAIVLIIAGIIRFIAGCINEDVDSKVDGVFGISVGVGNLAVAIGQRSEWHIEQ